MYRYQFDVAVCSLSQFFSRLGEVDFDGPTDSYSAARHVAGWPVRIAALGRDGPPSKMSEGCIRFLCPNCGEMQASVNPRNNLAHCFHCAKNLNNIDLLITLGYDFKTAAAVLEQLLERYEARLPKKKSPSST